LLGLLCLELVRSFLQNLRRGKVRSEAAGKVGYLVPSRSPILQRFRETPAHVNRAVHSRLRSFSLAFCRPDGQQVADLFSLERTDELWPQVLLWLALYALLLEAQMRDAGRMAMLGVPVENGKNRTLSLRRG
jgi:hypothetical protein